MANHRIKIKGINSDGTLKLSDGGYTAASKKDKVTWHISHDSGVSSITSIDKKPSSPEIFSTHPHKKGKNWQGVISSTAPDYSVYDYSISWLADDESVPHLYDPKISVKPSPASPIFDVAKLVFVLVAVVLSIFSIKFLSKNKK